MILIKMVLLNMVEWCMKHVMIGVIMNIQLVSMLKGLVQLMKTVIF